jgi:hypothetical protein
LFTGFQNKKAIFAKNHWQQLAATHSTKVSFFFHWGLFDMFKKQLHIVRYTNTNTNTNIYFSLRAWHTIDSQAAVTGNG